MTPHTAGHCGVPAIFPPTGGSSPRGPGLPAFSRRSVMIKSKQDRFTGLKLSELSDPERESVVRLAMKALAMKHRAGRTLSSPDETRNYLCLRLAEYRNEVFGCLLLDNLCRIIAVRELFQGTVNSASVHPPCRRTAGDGGECRRHRLLSQPPVRGRRTEPCRRDDHPPPARGARPRGRACPGPLRGLGRRERLVRGTGAALTVCISCTRPGKPPFPGGKEG